MTGSKFKVGDWVRRTEDPAGTCPVGTVGRVASCTSFALEVEGVEGCYDPSCFESAAAPKSVTIAHIIPLIKDARQLDNAAHVVCDRGGDTTLMDKMLTSLYAEIGEKVARAVEVDA